MSGGALDYVSYRIEDCVPKIPDTEIKHLVKDVADLLHGLEWYLSDDTGIEDWEEALAAFKKKWFKESRTDRLKGYVDEQIADLRASIYSMIGVEYREDTPKEETTE